MFRRVILIFVAFSFFLGLRLPIYTSVYVFDALLIIYVLIVVLHKRRLSKPLVLLTVAAFFVLLPSSVLMLNSTNITSSMKFMAQYYFTIVILPFFISSLLHDGRIEYFIKWIFVAGTIILITFFYSKYRAPLGVLPTASWGGRFSLGDFSPNEMGHFFVFYLFSLFFVFKTMKSRLPFYVSGVLGYAFSFSKTVYVQILLSIYPFWGRRVFILFVAFSVVMGGLFAGSYFYLLNDLSVAKSANSIRIEMMQSFLANIEITFLTPAYYEPANIDGVTPVSNHNILASFILNFGFLSFWLALLLCLFFWLLNRDKRTFLFVFPFMAIDFFGLLLNPMLSSRICWLPLFFYVSLILLDIFPRYNESKVTR